MGGLWAARLQRFRVPGCGSWDLTLGQWEATAALGGVVAARPACCVEESPGERGGREASRGADAAVAWCGCWAGECAEEEGS